MLLKRFIVVTLGMIVMLTLDIMTVEAGGSVRELEWNDLIPKGFDPNKVLDEYQQQYKIDGLPDDDPRVKELADKLRELRKQSPLNTALNGKQVKLPGFVVPLETNGQNSAEFLLVPYYGACIHVPPPPPNQTVYVRTQDKKGAAIRGMFDVVWVTGTMFAGRLTTDLADVGYTIDAENVEPFDE